MPPLPDLSLVTSDRKNGLAFYEAYYFLNELAITHRMEPVCHTAIKEYEMIQTENSAPDQNALLEWCVKYEQLGADDLVASYSLYVTEQSLVNNNYEVPTVNLQIDGKDFPNINAFLDLFRVYYDNSQLIVERYPNSIAAKWAEELKKSQAAYKSGEVAPF
jgi:hypothetical protein